MEQINQAIQKVQTENFSVALSSAETNETREVSLYGQGEVSAQCLALNIVKLKQAFPELPNGFYDLLETMLDEERFTDERLDDAVRNLIKTCPYPKPTIANLLGYDKKAKLFTWHELAEISKDFAPETRKTFWSKFVFIKPKDRYIEKIYEKFLTT